MRILRIILLIASLLTMVVCGWLMYDLPLWRHIPLWFSLALWVLVIFSRKKYILVQPIQVRWLMLAVLSGILMSIGFPPNTLFIASAIGFIPLLTLEKEIFSIYQKSRPWLFWRHLFAAFWLWNIFTTYWVSNSALVAGQFANIVNALLMTIPWVIWHYICRRNFSWWRYVILACLWIMFEHIHSSWELSWPWLTLGNVLGSAHEFAQWYEFTGYFGGSVWIWALNISGFFIMTGSIVRKAYLTGVSLLLLIIPSLFSLYIYNTYQEKGPTAQVVVVQPNYEPHYQKFSVPEHVQVGKMLSLATPLINKKTDLILFPETILDPVRLNNIYAQNPYIGSLHQLLDSTQNGSLLAGVGGFHLFAQNPGRNTVRESDGIYYEMYNAAILLKKDTANVQEYYKSKFVPGAEIFPYKKLLIFLKPLVNKLGGTYEGFAAQDSAKNFSFPKGEVAPMICYESIYGSWVRQFVNKGANLLAIMTNDGWWDRTPGYKQHLYLGRLRAIENRRDIIRSANTGVSCLIDQRGNISHRTIYGEDAAFAGKVQLNSTKTFYTRHGDWILWIVWSLGLSMIAFNYFMIRKQKKS